MQAKSWVRSACLVSLLSPLLCQVAVVDLCPKGSRIVVPYPAGAADDAIARIIAAKLSEERGRFYVENIPGATGAIGTSAVGKAAPDGCTLLIINQNFVIQPAVNAAILYDAAAGFSAVTLLATAPETIAVKFNRCQVRRRAYPASEEKSWAVSLCFTWVRIFTAYRSRAVVQSRGRRRPHVPFQGGPPAVNATIGGHTQIVHLTLPNLAPWSGMGGSGCWQWQTPNGCQTSQTCRPSRKRDTAAST